MIFTILILIVLSSTGCPLLLGTPGWLRRSPRGIQLLWGGHSTSAGCRAPGCRAATGCCTGELGGAQGQEESARLEGMGRWWEMYDRVSVPIERGLAKLQSNCFRRCFLGWRSESCGWAGFLSGVPLPPALPKRKLWEWNLAPVLYVITVSSDGHSSTNQWNWSMARFAASRSYCACFRAL